MSLSCAIVRRKVGLGPKPIKKWLPLTPCSDTHVSESADDKLSEPSIPGTKSISSRLGQVGHGEYKCKASLHIFCDDFCNCSSVSFKEDDESNSLDSNLGGGSLLEEKGYGPFQENKPFQESEPEEELDPEEIYDLEEEYNPKEVCDPEEEYDPEEDYDPEEEHNPEEDYDPEEDCDPEEGYDPEKARHPEEDGLFCSDKLEPPRASAQNEGKAGFELEDHRVSEEKPIVSNLGMEGTTVVVNKHRGYVEKEIIDIDSDDAEEECDPEEECCPEEEHDPEDGFFCSNKLEHAHASAQTEGTAGFELDLCVSEEKAIASNFGMERSTDIVNEDRGYVEKEIIGVDSDDQHIDGFGNETSNAGNQECVEIVKKMQEKRIHEIFLEGFDSNATKDDIKKGFGELGKVVNIKLTTDPQRNKNKVFAILSFATAEQADHALISLRRPVINGKRCDMYPADPVKCNNTLFLGNVCKKWTKETLEEKLKHFGIKKFKDLRLAEDASGAALKCGYAFLELHSQSDAMSAYKRLQQRDVILEADRSAKVCFAFPFIDLDNNIGTQVKRIFLDKLPVSWDHSHVREHFEKFGEIKKIELARHMPSAPRKDFGFVTYESHTAAVACLEFIKRASFHEGENEVNIKAMLSHPLAERTWKDRICGNFPVKQEPASSDVRESQGPALNRGSHRHQTKKERPRKESFGACSHKRLVEVRDRRQEPASRDVRESQGPALTGGSHRHQTKKERPRKESFGACSHKRPVEVRDRRQEPASRDVRGSQGPALTRGSHRHQTEKERPRKESFGACSHKRSVEVRDRRQEPASRDVRESQGPNLTRGSHRHRTEKERPPKESFGGCSHKRPVEVRDRRQEPASRDVRESQGPTLTRGSHRHQTEKERLRKESFGACGRKRPVEVRDQRQCKPLKRRVRPLPSGPVQMKPNPKKSTEYHPRDDKYYGSMARSMGPRNSFAMPRDTSLSQNRNLYEEEACGDRRSWNSAGVSTSTSHPKNLRSDVDAARGKSYVRRLPYCSERHSTDYASLSGLKRSSSALNEVPPRYSNKHSKVQKRTVKRNWSYSQGCQATAYSEHVTVEMEYSYQDIHQNRPRRHLGYQEYESGSVADRRHFSESFDDRRCFRSQESQANIHRDGRYSQYM